MVVPPFSERQKGFNEAKKRFYNLVETYYKHPKASDELVQEILGEVLKLSYKD